MRRGDIDGDPQSMRAETVGARDRPAIVTALQWSQVLQEFVRQPVEFVRDFLQRRRRAVDL